MIYKYRPKHPQIKCVAHNCILELDKIHLLTELYIKKKNPDYKPLLEYINKKWLTQNWSQPLSALVLPL